MPIDSIEELWDELDEYAANDCYLEYDLDDEADREFGRDHEWECAEEMADTAERELFRERYWKP